jgi:hypothetical protein
MTCESPQIKIFNQEYPRDSKQQAYAASCARPVRIYPVVVASQSPFVQQDSAARHFARLQSEIQSVLVYDTLSQGLRDQHLFEIYHQQRAAVVHAIQQHSGLISEMTHSLSLLAASQFLCALPR